MGLRRSCAGTILSEAIFSPESFFDLCRRNWIDCAHRPLGVGPGWPSTASVADYGGTPWAIENAHQPCLPSISIPAPCCKILTGLWKKLASDYPWLTIEITENRVDTHNINNRDKIPESAPSKERSDSSQYRMTILSLGLFFACNHMHPLPLKSPLRIAISHFCRIKIDTSDRDYQMVKTIAGLGRTASTSQSSQKGLKTITTCSLFRPNRLRLWAGIPVSRRPSPADELEATVLKMP